MKGACSVLCLFNAIHQGKQTWKLNRLSTCNSLRPTCCMKRNSPPCLFLCLFYSLCHDHTVWFCLCNCNTFPALCSTPRPWQFQSLQWKFPRGLRMAHLREKTEWCQTADWRVPETATVDKHISFQTLNLQTEHSPIHCIHGSTWPFTEWHFLLTFSKTILLFNSCNFRGKDNNNGLSESIFRTLGVQTEYIGQVLTAFFTENKKNTLILCWKQSDQTFKRL